MLISNRLPHIGATAPASARSLPSASSGATPINLQDQFARSNSNHAGSIPLLSLRAPEKTEPATLKAAVESGVPNPMPAPADPKLRDWRDDTIYFVMTDRFKDADPSNNHGADKSDIHAWHGGDFQGLIDKADYIRGTGATALWITPPMDSQQRFVDTEGYHGYWPVDYYKVDEHLGDMEKFKELVDVYHDKGMKVIVDIPLNHVAWEHPLWTDPNKASLFHHNGDVTDWDNDWQQENCSIFGLPDWAQENPETEKYLMEVGEFWAKTGIDGFRLDAVRSVPKWFWEKFNNRMHEVAGDDFLLLGEYYHGDAARLAPYQSDTDMDSLVDYPMYYRIKETFAKGGSMREVANGMSWTNNTYKDPELMGIFADNHDTQRFLTEAGDDKDRLKMALAFVMTTNRIPTIYYGSEQSFTSDKTGWAETSRKDMVFDKDPEMHGFFQKLGAIRNDLEPLRRGELLEMWQDDQVYAFDRKSEHGEAIVVFNNAETEQHRAMPLRAESKLQDGTVLKDLLSERTVTVKDGRIEQNLPAKSAGIFVPLPESKATVA
ncbi:MAG: alpha-amylase family glycosyl hydrolase [Vulcanimicrobiota bacterium]